MFLFLKQDIRIYFGYPFFSQNNNGMEVNHLLGRWLARDRTASISCDKFFVEMLCHLLFFW